MHCCHLYVQAMAAGEGGHVHELDELANEAEMPLEQLLAQYGRAKGESSALAAAGESLMVSRALP